MKQVCSRLLHLIYLSRHTRVIDPLRLQPHCHQTDSQLCIGIQDLLDNANISDPAQIEAYQMYRYAYPLYLIFTMWQAAPC